MAQQLDARVRQKTDTLANWLANPLPLLGGEQAFVKSDLDDTAIAFKIGDDSGKTFAELPYPDFSVRGKASTATVWNGSTPSGLYVPTEAGTYSGVTVVLSDGYQILYWDGTTLVKVIFPISLAGYATLTNLNVTYDFTNPKDGFYQADGIYNPVNTWKTIFFQFTGGVTYSLYGTASGSGSNLLTYLDANRNVLGHLASGPAGLQTGSATIPSTTVIVAASTLGTQTGSSFVKIANSASLANSNSSALPSKADHGYTGSDSIKTLKQVEANIGKVNFQNTSFPDNGFWTPAGTYNSSVNFKSVTVACNPGDVVSYHTYLTGAGGGSNAVTFLDNSNVIKGSVQITTGSTSLRTGNATAPTGTTKVTFSTFGANLSDSYVTYPTDSGPLFTTAFAQINTKADKPSSVVLTVSKTATPDATHFNTVAAAIAAYTTGAAINIFDGIYLEQALTVPDGCYIKGIGNVEIRGSLADNSTSVSIDATSTFDFQNSGTLENLTITCRNMRYPVHSDFGNPLATQKVINCRLIHYGNSGAYNYRVTNAVASPNAPADTWLAQSAWGCGTQSGSKIYLTDCYLQSPMRAFSTHDNADYNLSAGASFIQCDNCDFISYGTALDGSALAFKPSAFVQSLASNTYDTVVFNNCRINGFLVLQSTSADWREFTQDVRGGGNSNHLMQVRNFAGGSKLMTSQTTTQTAFIIKVNAPNTSDIVVSGNLVDSIFGNYRSLKGSTGLNSWIKGRVNHGKAFANVNAYGGTKTITFAATGTTSKTLTLSTTYVSATQMVADMNTQFGGSSFVAELYWPGFDWYPNFTDEINTCQNNGATAITRGKAVKLSGLNGVALMTSADAANLFYGIACVDIPVGQVGAVKYKGYMLRIWAEGLFGTTLADNDNIKVNSDGTFSKATGAGGEVVVSKCISNENITINT